MALFNEGTALAQAGRLGEAVDPLAQCLQQAPKFGPGFTNLAYTLHRLGVLDKAQVIARAGYDLTPHNKEASLILAAILHENSDFAGAAKIYEALLARDPENADILRSYGRSLQALGRLSEALAVHVRSIAASPEGAEGHFNYADALLAAGDFNAGWAEYEWRWSLSHVRPRALGPAWTGDDLRGRTILLHAEQGFGDTLQFARYAPMVAARGGRVVLEVQRPLLRLMRSLEGVDQVLGQGDTLPSFDVHCPLMSLPRAFSTELTTVPADIPYLQPDPSLVTAWELILRKDRALQVGLVWAGSAHQTEFAIALANQRRSMPLSTLAPLGQVAGLRFISLQTGEPAEELRSAPPGLKVSSYLSEGMDFADTAALVATLDLVITVDTAVAHLAGALGVPVWVLSRFDGCWRWLKDRDDSPWYPTLRLYRQKSPMDWAGVMARVQEDLTALALGSRPQCPSGIISSV